MKDVMSLANGSVVWIFATIVVGIVIFQGIKFILLARKAGQDIGMTTNQLNSALKTGAIAAIGPSIAIVIVAISLIPFLGEPLTLLRIGIIGSAPIESVGASLGAEAYGTELGSAEFNKYAFTAVVWTLCLGGIGWLVFTALATKSLSNIERKVVSKSKNGKQGMVVFTTAALVAAFGNLVSGEMIKGGIPYIIVALVASTTMVICMKIADKMQLNWLREWSLGLSIIVSVFIGYFTL